MQINDRLFKRFYMNMIHLQYTDIFDENKIKELSFSKDSIKESFNEKSLFALIVDGKSMEPLIKDKAVIVVDLSQKKLLDEAIYVIYYKAKMWIKKYDKTINCFVSINPDFSHLIYKKDDVHLVGKVLLPFANL